LINKKALAYRQGLFDFLAPQSGLETRTYELPENWACEILIQINDLKAKIIDVYYFV